MIPGDLCQWRGNELFTRSRMGISGAFECPAGGAALVISFDSYVDKDDDDLWFTQEMVLVLVNDQLGWSPENWLEPLQ